MSGFTKLVPEICESSIWNQPSDIRIVWITLLAKKDIDGYVRGDTQTIARIANVPLESCKAALEVFQSPDLSSHTPDNDGRRIAPLPGGWLVLNHDKYREEGMTEAQREYFRDRKRLQRKNKAHLSKTCPRQVLESDASASASESDPVGRGEGKPIEEEIKESLRWYELVYSAFPVTPPSYPDQIVLANCQELIRLGRKFEELENLCGWVRTGQCGKYGPNSPEKLTRPTEWDKWCTMRHKSKMPDQSEPVQKLNPINA